MSKWHKQAVITLTFPEDLRESSSSDSDIVQPGWQKAKSESSHGRHYPHEPNTEAQLLVIKNSGSISLYIHDMYSLGAALPRLQEAFKLKYMPCRKMGELVLPFSARAPTREFGPMV